MVCQGLEQTLQHRGADFLRRHHVWAILQFTHEHFSFTLNAHFSIRICYPLRRERNQSEMSKQKTILAVIADETGEVFEHPDMLMAGMNGMTICHPEENELIPLPEGSRLFTIPVTPPIGFARSSGKQKTIA